MDKAFTMRQPHEPAEDPDLIIAVPETYPSIPRVYSTITTSSRENSLAFEVQENDERTSRGNVNKRKRRLPREVMDKKRPYKFAYQYKLPKEESISCNENIIGGLISNISLEYHEDSLFTKVENYVKKVFTFEKARAQAVAYRRSIGQYSSESPSRSSSQLDADFVSAKLIQDAQAIEEPAKHDPYEPIPSTSKCPTPPPPLPRPKSSVDSNLSIASPYEKSQSIRDISNIIRGAHEDMFRPLGPNKSTKPVRLIKKPRTSISSLKLKLQKSPQKLFGRIKNSLGSFNQSKSVQMPLKPLSKIQENVSLSHDDHSDPTLEDFVSIEPEPNNVFRVIKQASYNNGRDAMIIARGNNDNDTIGIKIRTEASGYLEWMNELQVYLLPDFKHENILEFYGWDKRYSTDVRDHDCFNDGENEVPDENEKEKMKCRAYPIRIEYWLMTKNCEDFTTLRDYLRKNTLSWLEMLHIARGIMQGIHFLHDNHEYQKSIDAKKAVEGFMKSTNGAIKKVAFKEASTKRVIYMRPYLSLAVIHRNLSSLNIVLKRDLTPCIWNFGSSHVIHPFQPANAKQYIDLELKESILTSQYTAPEVLQERGHLTAVSMKAIDIYSCGIIFWELMSRCVLPKLEDATEMEDKERSEPDEYSEPFEKEFGKLATGFMLKYAVLKKHSRPTIPGSWLAGSNTNRFAQTFQDMWDQDYDARLHPLTVIDRINSISQIDVDSRFKYKCRTSEVFVIPKNWPIDKHDTDQAPPYPKDCEPNIFFGSLSDEFDSSNRVEMGITV